MQYIQAFAELAVIAFSMIESQDFAFRPSSAAMLTNLRGGGGWGAEPRATGSALMKMELNDFWRTFVPWYR